jgi:hypothetical protein
LTVHVDEFLYDEEDVEELVQDGKLKRNYCKDCGSKNIDSLSKNTNLIILDNIYNS